MKAIKIMLCMVMSFSVCGQNFSDEQIISGTDFLNYSISGTNAAPTSLVSNHEIPDFISGSNFEIGYKIKQVTNRIILEISQSQSNLNFDFSIEVPILITYKKKNSNSANYTKTIVLQVDYNNASGTSFKQKDLFQFEEGYDFNIQVQENNISYSTTLTSQQKENIADQLFIKSYLIYEKMVDFDMNNILTFSNIQINYQSISNSVEVCWDPIVGAVEYDLEWTYAESYDPYWIGYPNGPYVGITGATYDFTESTARITTRGSCYKLPLTYERGLLGFRVRGKGFDILNDQLLIGNWSCSRYNGICNSYDNISPIDWWSSVGIHPAHEEDKINWQVVTTYAEEGKRKDVINYMDGSMRNRQTVTAINSDQNVLVAETIYDHQGRAAIQTLPVPIRGDMKLSYKQNLNQNSGSQPYNKDNFDFDPANCAGIIAEPMPPNSGSAYYYSQNFYNDLTPEEQTSHHAYLPRSHGFPFIHTQYTADNTGRIAKQGGAGPEYQIGSGHETKYFYGTPLQAELDKLFETNVGVANHYKKNMVIDPNGQVSISYLDAKGNTIATALAGEAPSGLEQLDSYLPEVLKVNLLTFNEENTNDYVQEANYTILVASNASYSFDYSMEGQQFLDDCMGPDVCYDCIYDLEILLIQKTCGDTIFTHRELIGELDYSCNAQHTFQFQKDTILNIGAYHLSKKLYVNDAAAGNYVDHYMNDPDNFCTNVLDSFLLEELSQVDTMDCMIPCNSIPDPAGDPDLLDWEASVCDTLPPTLCEIAEINMKADLTPGGQYALYDDDFSASAYPLSFLNPSCELPDMPYYTSITFSSQDYILFNGVTTDPASLSLENFILNFQESWTAYFIEDHPEYCYLLRCDNIESSYVFDAELSQTNSYAEALSAGMININSSTNIILNVDPYYLTHLDAGQKNSFENIINSFSGSPGISIHDLSLLMAFCDNGQIPGCNPNTLIANATTEQLNAYWQAYRALYQTIKNNFEYHIRTEEAIANRCYNECIGQQNFNPFINEFADISISGVFSWGPFSESDQSCNLNIYHLFEDKQKRFPSIYDMLGDMEIDYYNSTPDEILDYLDGSIPSNHPTCDTCEESNILPELINYALDYPKNEAINQGVPPAFFQYMRKVYQLNIQNDPTAMVTLLAQYPSLGTPTQIDQYQSIYVGILSPNVFIPFQDIEVAFPSLIPFLNQQPGNSLSIVFNEDNMSFTFGDGCNIGLDLTALSEYENHPIIGNGILAYTDWNVSNFSFDSPTTFSCNLGFYSDFSITITGTSDCNFCEANTDCEVLPIASDLMAFMNTFNWAITAGLGDPQGAETMQYTGPEEILTGDLFTLLTHDDPNSEFSYGLEINRHHLYLQSETGCGLYLDMHKNFNASNLSDLQFFQNLVPDFSQSNSLGYVRDFTIDVVLTNETVVTLQGRTNGCFFIGRCCTEVVPPNPSDPGPRPTLVNNANLRRLSLMRDFTRRLPRILPVVIIPQDETFDPLCNECPTAIVDGGIYGGLDLGENCKDIYCQDSIEVIEYGDINSDCLDFLYEVAENNAMIRYEQYMDSLKRDLKMRYMQKCLQATETFTGEFAYAQHHFTLYYYDQANNLLQTVPPNGVETLDDSEMLAMWDYREAQELHNADPSNPMPIAPAVGSIVPEWASEYEYNSLNQIHHQKMPDQRGPFGKLYTHFYYDHLGRIVASQNPEQILHDAHSYTVYDDLGRVVESGLSALGGFTLPNRPINTGQYNGGAFNDAESVWLSLISATKSEISYTQYDTPFYGDPVVPSAPDFEQTNLRGRVAAAIYYDTQSQYTSKTPDYATHYSYDIHGNVKELHQETKRIGNKKIEYAYDLISGNVNEVAYQKDQLDQFTHQYEYDADNRLTEVYTSRDGYIWDNDASYKYYLHGPQARIELGQDSVQGMDYAYTLQGWIKGMNSASLQQDHDIGQDGMLGHTHSDFAKDEVGYILNYNQTDYEAIYPNALSLRKFESNFNDIDLREGLYNGNIRSTITSIDEFMTTGHPSGYTYSYDQLNRIKGMSYHTDFDSASNSWDTANINSNYRAMYSYDPNGNLLTIERDAIDALGNPLAMDQFSYNYTSNSNQLTHVDDSITATNYNHDIDDQNAGNYNYDNIGNLTKDEAEGILNISWTNQGKIAKVIKDTGDEVSFYYDALGNRIAKVYGDTTLHYVRDATGNVMAHFKDIQTSSFALPHRTLESLTIYGSNRFGEYQPNRNMYQAFMIPPNPLLNERRSKQRRGALQYELSNHLGNVLATVSDKKKVGVAQFQHSGQNSEVKMASDYWPFGASMIESEKYYKYGFGGFEKLHREHFFVDAYNLKDLGYNSKIARRFTMDPKHEKFTFSSTYNYCNNNPILFIDPSGEEWINVHTDRIKNIKKQILDNPDKKRLKRDLKKEYKREARVNDYISNLESNDKHLYNYIDQLEVSDVNGNKRNVKVYVTSDPRLSGNNGQMGETSRYPIAEGTKPNVLFNGKDIVAPRGDNGTPSFDITIYGKTSFGDVYLSNEVGDVMYFMEFNENAIKEKGDQQYFENGRGGYDEYSKSGSSAYSKKVENFYKQRKSDKPKSSENPYPISNKEN